MFGASIELIGPRFLKKYLTRKLRIPLIKKLPAGGHGRKAGNSTGTFLINPADAAVWRRLILNLSNRCMYNRRRRNVHARLLPIDGVNARKSP